MFKKIVELIKEALRYLAGYDNVTDTITTDDTFIVSQKMEYALETWRSMYKDESPWLDEKKGVFSLGIAKQVCQSLAMQVLAEMKCDIVVPGECEECQDELAHDSSYEPKNLAEYINLLFKRSLLPKLPDVVEKGMALGGVVIKPYHTDNGTFVDFSYQGEFVPIAFDDDNNIIDIAFLDQFTEGNSVFTKVERQTFIPADKVVIVQNKAFVAKIPQSTGEGEVQKQQLGKEVPISSIPRWAGISEEPVVIEDVIKPLYGYYRVPLANNVDFECPMGISVFSPAVSLIKRADMQFSRLDWEYEGGQMAIDIDRNAIRPEQGYFNEHFDMDQLKDRLYRRLDLGVDDTYNVFAPGLRDDRYINGLNRYLSKIEDAIGLARGTLNDDMPTEARTATEVRILKQRTYTTISTNQKALEKALEDVADAIKVYARLYSEVTPSAYAVNIEWQDSVLSDTNEELNHRLQLKNAGVLSDVEVRMWFTGEDEKTAQAAIDAIRETQIETAKANAEATVAVNQEAEIKKTERDNDRKDAQAKKDDKKIKDAKPEDK